MQELYGEQPPPLDRELLWMQPCSFQQLHREQQPPASNPPAAAGTSAPHAPAGSAGCAASTASSSAQNAPAQEESPALDLGQEIEKMIREIRNSLPVKAPSAQGNINVAPESPREDPMNRAAAEEVSSGTESCRNSSPEPEEPVKKPDGSYRLVQDLREVNKRTRSRYPVVPNPYTLLSKVPPQHQWFSVVDLKDAFWACPLAKESRDIFAFEWEDPKTGRKQQLRWTKLPQGFTESPNLFGQALEKILQAFSTPPRIQIIQYVDDLLLSGEDEVEVREATIKLLNFLGEKGLRVSKGKLQFVEPEVKYLGHLISKGSRRLSPERIAGILSLPPPSSKREIRKLLGLLGYCRLWIEGYTQAVKFLYEKLTEGDNIKWTKEDDDKLEKLKLKLASIPALSLPSLEKPFHLYVNVEKGVAHGVLVQEWGGVKRPVAYLSKMLDPVSHGWPVCIQAIAATAILVEESRKLTFGGKLIVCTPHAVRNELNQKAEKWLTDSRMLKYEAILIDSDDLTLEVNRSLNPAQFLYGEPADNLIHNCLEIIQYQTKVRGDLEEQALSEGEIIYVDGSSRCLQGKKMSGYAVVDGKNMQTIEKGKLPSNWSAQTCELYALKKALEYLAHKKGTIYTDSRSDLGVSPYEMMFGLPFLTTQHENATYEVGEMSVKRYVNTIAKTLENLRLKGIIPQTTPLDFKIHNVHPGEWVLVKTWKEQSLTPQWEGPFQVLLTTEAAIRTKERGWIHASKIKGPVEEPKEWTITSEPGDTKLTLKRGLGGNELGRPKWSKKHTQDHT
ncbi:hypothetical protein DUI87_34981 [Hirundo rustica rustica]|uniref:ribonuclease H n=1 Tax=Hirundo rustica rustica TaxID=333673 RepID=A0A3M0IJX4_HIRRU|nr:hypothetical protein DUI87_34981 [Hirundo rustica rustica]